MLTVLIDYVHLLKTVAYAENKTEQQGKYTYNVTQRRFRE
jgi:hypothetical protein